jgi:hypothetical protein
MTINGIPADKIPRTKKEIERIKITRIITLDKEMKTMKELAKNANVLKEMDRNPAESNSKSKRQQLQN